MSILAEFLCPEPPRQGFLPISGWTWEITALSSRCVILFFCKDEKVESTELKQVVLDGSSAFLPLPR